MIQHHPAIEVSHLSCGYGQKAILKKLSFSVPQGELLFIIGGSGCGKSTLLRSMIGLQPPLGGSVSYFGKNFTTSSEEDRQILLQKLGVLYQSTALWSSMTVRENLALPLEQYTSLNKKDREEVVALKLAQVGMSGVQDLYPRQLSGGMKKRIGLARALALDPQIVFFDEPSAGLDPITSREIDDLILEVRNTLGTTMVIISHELASIFRIGDRILLLDPNAHGIIADGEPHELAKASDDPRVKAFLNQTNLSSKKSL